MKPSTVHGCSQFPLISKEECKIGKAFMFYLTTYDFKNVYDFEVTHVQNLLFFTGEIEQFRFSFQDAEFLFELCFYGLWHCRATMYCSHQFLFLHVRVVGFLQIQIRARE